MQQIKFLFVCSVLLLTLFSCGNHEAKKYGPVTFEIPIEGPIFAESLAEGVVTLAFTPEDFGISRKEIHSMKLDEIELTTDHPDGLAIFDNVVFTVMTDNTESKEVASTKIKGNPKTMTIKGLEQAEIEGFAETDKFYLEMTGISKKDFDDNITVKGKMILSVMVDQK